MAKLKANQTPTVPGHQKAVFTRQNFLYQAAALLALPQPPLRPTSKLQSSNAIDHTTSTSPAEASAHVPTTTSTESADRKEAPDTTALSRYYLTTLLSTSKKSVLRLDRSVKRTICKRCHSFLIPGISSTTRLENKSRRGRKRMADVLVIGCEKCGGTKRFPLMEGINKKGEKAKNKNKNKNKKIEKNG